MAGKDWSKNEINYLKKYYKSRGPEFIAKRFNRTYNAVISKSTKLGLRFSTSRAWEKWEENYLIKHFHDRQPTSIAKTLKRTVNAIKNRAGKLNLTGERAKSWTEREKALLKLKYPNRSFSIEEIASQLGRTIVSLYSAAKILKINRPRYDHEWTKEEHDYILSNYKNKTFKQIAVDLNLSSDAVILYANRKGIFRKNRLRRWANDEIEYVKNNYSTLTMEEMAAKLNRTVKAVQRCAGRLGLQGKHNWYKPANIEARVRKFKIWKMKQKQKPAEGE